MTLLGAEGQTVAGHRLFKEKPKERLENRQPVPFSPVKLGEHGRYQIKSGRLAGEYVARAFPKPPTNVRSLIAEAMGETEEAAIAALYEIIDAREIRRTGDRRFDPHTNSRIPSTEEYTEALGQVGLSQPQLAMLKALALANAGLTEMDLARAAGYKSRSSANRGFAAAGLLVARFLSSEAAFTELLGEADGSTMLGFRGEQKSESELGNWMLHPEVRESVRVLL